jgi:nucleotide-binding universal stress UspA family protein
VEGLRQAAEEEIQTLAGRLRVSGCSVSTRVLFGDAKAAIVDHAAEIGADLILVGSHGKPGLKQFFIGSVANAVVRFAPCSVEIVRDQNGTDGKISRVLLATDGSESSELAARSIAERPWPAGSEIRVFSVVELHMPLFEAPYPPYLNAHAMEDLRAEAMRKAEQALAAAEEIIVNAGLPQSSTVAVPADTPEHLILKEAVDWDADLIVVGSHGRRGISRFLMGSVSEAVASHAPCSVEVIRQRRKAA